MISRFRSRQVRLLLCICTKKLRRFRVKLLAGLRLRRVKLLTGIKADITNIAIGSLVRSLPRLRPPHLPLSVRPLLRPLRLPQSVLLLNSQHLRLDRSLLLRLDRSLLLNSRHLRLDRSLLLNSRHLRLSVLPRLRLLLTAVSVSLLMLAMPVVRQPPVGRQQVVRQRPPVKQLLAVRQQPPVKQLLTAVSVSLLMLEPQAVLLRPVQVKPLVSRHQVLYLQAGDPI